MAKIISSSSGLGTKQKTNEGDFVLERDIDFREMKEEELTPEIVAACTAALDMDSSEFTNI